MVARIGRNKYDVGGEDSGTQKQVHAGNSIRYLRGGARDERSSEGWMRYGNRGGRVSSVVPPLQRPMDGGTEDGTQKLDGQCWWPNSGWHLVLAIHGHFAPSTAHRAQL